MIDLYYWTTPNGHKITMYLEEANSPTACTDQHFQGEQFAPDFLKISPTTRSRRSSTMRRPTAASRSACSSLARSSSTSRARREVHPKDLRGR